MPLQEISCPRCNAPITPQSRHGLTYCSFCGAALIWDKDTFQISPSYPADQLVESWRPRFWLSGHRYRVLGRLAEGESTDAFLALRDHRLTERIVARCLRAEEDDDLLRAEWATLQALQASAAPGAQHFTRLLPQPVAYGSARLGVRGRSGSCTMLLYGFASGFVHTFLDARRHYADGIPPTAAVWLWKRILELASFIHSSGYVHGALVPRHLLIHARDHGVRFCGFGAAVRSGRPLVAFPVPDAAFNSGAGAAGRPVGPSHDICTSARAILWLLGGNPRQAPAATPAPLRSLLERAAQPDAGGLSDAWATRDALDAAAQSVFGPPRFVPFHLPGWDFKKS